MIMFIIRFHQGLAEQTAYHSALNTRSWDV